MNLAFDMRRKIRFLHAMEIEDLVQECMHRVLWDIEDYDPQGRASFKSWAVDVVRGHILSLSRRLATRKTDFLEELTPEPGTDSNGPKYEPSCLPDVGRRLMLRSQTQDLLGWLSKSPDGVQYGWEVLNLLLKTHGNRAYAAKALSIHTGQKWTLKRVDSVLAQISVTPRGRDLCESLGIRVNEGEV